MSNSCWTVSNRVGPCQNVLDRVKSVLDRVWVRFDPAGVKELKSFLKVNLQKLLQNNPDVDCQDNLIRSVTYHV